MARTFRSFVRNHNPRPVNHRKDRREAVALQLNAEIKESQENLEELERWIRYEDPDNSY